MILRIAVGLALCIVASAADAERVRPPEIYSPRPVQVPPRFSGRGDRIIYSQWVKFCGKTNPDPKEICLTAKETRLDNGQFVAGAALIEEVGAEKKLLRVSAPKSLRGYASVRVAVGDQTRAGAFSQCVPNGCFADFPVDADFVAQLKSAPYLQLESADAPWPSPKYQLSLDDFARAYNGPPTDPREDWQRRGEEQRRRLQEFQHRHDELLRGQAK
jgi:invasion protein IalB